MSRAVWFSRLSLCLVVSLISLAFSLESFAQTSLGDVHIAPRGLPLSGEESVAVARMPVGLGVIHSSVDLVMVPVTITDGMNRPVVGLGENNFQLFENKKPQQIRHFSIEDSPVSIGIIMDASGSMTQKIERAREAVHQFCETANPQNEFFMITFSNAPQLVADFTDRPEEIESALIGIQPKGQTSLLDAIYMGIRKMKDARYARRALLILSDGGDNHSRYSERDVKRAVKEADVLIYAVGTYDSHFTTREEILGPELLSEVSEVTGGEAYTLSNVGEMPAVTRAIGNLLRHQYVIAYRPPTKQRDGKWHKINVKLLLPKKLRPFLRVDARTGYYAGAE